MPHPMLAPLLRSGPWRLMVLALLLAGCGDSGIITPLDNAPMQLVLTPSDVVMNNHETVQLEMGQRLPDGRVIPLDAPVVWSSSSPAVANVDGTGLLLARLPGDVTIRASSRWGDVSGRVTILPVSADLSLEVTDHLRMVAGSAAPTELRARIMDSAGRPVPGVRVDFSVQGSSVSLSPASRSTGSDGYASTWVQVGERAREFDLLVSSPGLEVPAAGAAVAGNGGPAAASAPPGQLRKAVRLEVSPSDPASLEVIPGDAQMVRGEERTFAAVIRDEFGNTIETSDVRWRTLDNGVATVSSSGRVTALVAGATQVAAEHGRGPRRVEGASEVLVGTGALPVPAALRIVSGSGQSTSVRGEIDGLTIEVRDEAGRPMAGVAAMWSVRSGSGTMLVPATSTDADGRSSNTFVAGAETGPVTVRAEVEGLPAVSFDLTVGTASLRISAPRTSLTSLGETVQLAAEARDEAGNVVDAPSLTWTSSETNVASVNSSGRVIANAIGTAIISVAAACCSGDQISISVTQEVASVQVSPSSTSIDVGASRQFNVEARDANGNPVPGVSATWSSSNLSVATVTSTGRVSAVSQGSAQIRASVAGQVGHASLTVGSTSSPSTGSGLYPNQPAGWVVHREQEFRSLTDNTGAIWGSMLNPPGGGELRLNVSDPTSPDGTGIVAEVFFPAGMADGMDAGRIGTSTPRNQREVFIGDYIKFSAGFQYHNMGIKMLLFNVHQLGWITMGGGGESPIRGSNPATQPPNMSVGSRCGGCIRTSAPLWNNGEIFTYNVQYPPAYTTGQWMRREFYFRLNSAPGVRDGVVRQWIDGVLTTEYTDIDWGMDAPDWGSVVYGFTWGGGGSAVPQNQTIRIAHFRMTHPQ
jgi:uncharacterized protein YjdB